METYKLIYKPLGSIALLIEWPQQIELSILKNITLFRSEIQTQLSEIVLDTVPAYCSLTVFFDTGKTKYSSVVKKVKEIHKKMEDKNTAFSNIWKIPVCYDEEFGIDLEEVSKAKGLSKEKVIKIHGEPIYDVYFVGFLPGFLYLGGLNEKLHYKRKSKPQAVIPMGAVGIAGGQTGIYPRESPGGWNIIGNSPLRFFDADTNPPCFAKPGDKVQFISINKETYNIIKNQVEIGTYVIEFESYGQ